MARHGFAARLAFLLGGLLVWAGHFLFVYGFNGLACARGFDRNTVLGAGIVVLTVGIATAVAVLAAAGIGILAVLGRGPGIGDEPDPAVRAFWQLGAAVLAGFSVVAVLWTGLPALMIEPCA